MLKQIDQWGNNVFPITFTQNLGQGKNVFLITFIWNRIRVKICFMSLSFEKKMAKGKTFFLICLLQKNKIGQDYINISCHVSEDASKWHDVMSMLRDNLLTRSCGLQAALLNLYRTTASHYYFQIMFSIWKLQITFAFVCVSLVG